MNWNDSQNPYVLVKIENKQKNGRSRVEESRREVSRREERRREEEKKRVEEES